MTYQEMERAAYNAADYDRAALYQALIDLENENAEHYARIQDQDEYIQSLVRENERLTDRIWDLEQVLTPEQLGIKNE